MSKGVTLRDDVATETVRLWKLLCLFSQKKHSKLVHNTESWLSINQQSLAT